MSGRERLARALFEEWRSGVLDPEWGNVQQTGGEVPTWEEAECTDHWFQRAGELLALASPQPGDGSEGEAGAVEVLLEQTAERIRSGVKMGEPHAVACEEAAKLLTALRSTPLPDGRDSERLAALLGEARVIVRACQWGSTANYGASAACPMCRNAHERGHLEGCEIPTWLAAASPKTLSEDWLEARQRSVVVICEYCAGPLTCDSCDNPRPAGEGEP